MSQLAIDGGRPVRTEPFPIRQQIDDREIDAVMALLQQCRDSGGAFDRYAGTQVDGYEREFADYIGTQFGTAVSAGTGAIHTALGALRLDVGSEVISSPITDPGAVAPILWSNCIPVFADADPDTMNMAPDSVRERISDKTRAIVAGHIAGQPCDMDPIMEIAGEHGLYVIEDCAQAHGAEYRGRKAGSIGHLSAFSLMSGKHSTAGGQGGMVLTDDEELFWNAKRFADRGKPFEAEGRRNLFLGNNYRMTELEAVIGRVQLQKLPQIVAHRQRAVARLGEAIADLQAVRPGKVIDGAVPSYWFVLVYVDEKRLTVGKAEFAAAVAAEGIPCAPSYDHIVYEQDWIRDRQTYGTTGCPWVCPFYGREIKYEGSCPGARLAIDAHMMLSVHECYTDREADDIAAALRKVEAAYLG
jgi:dTDP-4-amino-4,6-dideoxygalactose transaminase